MLFYRQKEREKVKNDRKKDKKAVDICGKSVYNIGTMQVSPSGMAAASQAVPGEFDSRHLLQVSIIRTICLQQANGSDLLFIWIRKML